MDSKFAGEEKGQVAAQAMIATAALVFVGILVIANVFSGAGVGYVVNETLGNTTGADNTSIITSYTTTNSPISDHADHTPVLINQSATFTLGTDVNCEAPCYFVNYGNGNVTVNASVPGGSGLTSDVIQMTYYESDVTGSGLATLVEVEGYLWTGLGFLGLGLLVLGAVFVLRIVRQMGG